MPQDQFSIYAKRLEKALVRGDATEQTHRPALKWLIELLRPGITATNEPKRIECGAPDYVISTKSRGAPMTIGYIETKDVGTSLQSAQKSEQLKRYREALPNLILSDYLEFRWYADGELRQTTRLGSVAPSGKLARDRAGERKSLDLLNAFLEREPGRVCKPQELAQRLARLAHVVRNIVVTAFRKGIASPMLADLRNAFAQTLIPDLDKPEKIGEFADMYAQAIAYGLFAARCNHDETKGPFRRLGAAAEIPKTNPFLRTLFNTITGPELDDEPYARHVNDIAQLLAHSDMSKILEQFGKSTRREDPVVHFYETFLAAYDRKLRKSRGVYYTPEPVVSYIVRSVDWLLKQKFGLAGGLADTAQIKYPKTAEEELTTPSGKGPRVLILDPVCGTGTFLYTVIEHIREQFMKKNDAGLWSGYVRKHLLPRLFGFELLMAPYAVAHLKLGMQLGAQDLPELHRKNWAYDFQGNERLHVYLTNSLEEAEKKAKGLFGPLRVITEEANAASRIKRDLPIMVVMGNPPYSNFGRMNQGKWIRGLLEDYKKGLHEKKLNLDDDFIKFIRFAQWRVERTGAGILAFITNNTYIDGITHRRMRDSLLKTFTDIYIVNLHGSGRRSEVAPDGSKDENVFDIQQGVAIAIFVKSEDREATGCVRYSEVWGARETKYSWLNSEDVSSTEWAELHPGQDYFFFAPKDFTKAGEYSRLWSLRDIAPVHQNGLKTDRDELFFDFEYDRLAARMRRFFSGDPFSPEFKTKYRVENSSSYDLLARREENAFHPNYLHRCLYRPFDFRWLYYGSRITSRAAWKVMQHMLAGRNRALVASRQFAGHKYFTANSTKTLTEISSQPYAPLTLFPLYLYAPSSQQEQQLEIGPRRPNLNPKFIADMEQGIGLKFSPDGAGDLKKTFGPEDVFHYIYAVLHSPTYRERYAEFLKIDFPRIPLTPDLKLFRRLCELGAELTRLHLMEQFGKDITSYPVNGDNAVEKVRYSQPDQKHKGRVWINKTQYVEGVPPEVWEFHVGGYQVCRKWLKDRKGRTLSFEDIEHYEHVVAALHETLRLMSEIDAAIGKWPIE